MIRNLVLIILSNFFILFISTQEANANALSSLFSVVPSNKNNKNSKNNNNHHHQLTRNLASATGTSTDSKWIALEKLKEDFDDDPVTGFGFSIATSKDGKIVIIGSPFHHSNRGKVVIHRYDSNSRKWIPMGRGISGIKPSDTFGKTVAVAHSGLVIAVGSPGAAEETGSVSIFRYDSTTDEWEQIGEDIEGQVQGEGFGSSLAMSDTGDVIAVGAPHAQYTPGKVRVYR